MLEESKPDDTFYMPGQQQIFDHVEDEQRLHTVVGETLPRLGEGEEPQSFRMAEECAIAVIDLESRCRFRSGHARLARASITAPWPVRPRGPAVPRVPS